MSCPQVCEHVSCSCSEGNIQACGIERLFTSSTFTELCSCEALSNAYLCTQITCLKHGENTHNFYIYSHLPQNKLARNLCLMHENVHVRSRVYERILTNGSKHVCTTFCERFYTATARYSTFLKGEH